MTAEEWLIWSICVLAGIALWGWLIWALLQPQVVH